MARISLRTALQDVREQELVHFGRVANRLSLGRPSLTGGSRVNRARAGKGFEFLEYRTYVPGDALRTVDWRASARSRWPQVRRFVDEASVRWFICLDASASMGVRGGAKWLLGVQLAAAWSYLLLQGGHQVGLLQFAEQVFERCPAGRGRAQYQRIITHLRDAVHPVHGASTRLAECSRWLGRRGSAVVLSDFLQPDALSPDLDQLLGRGGRVLAIQILSSQECRPLPSGPVTLRDVETGRTRAVEGGWEASAAAAARLDRTRRELADHCNSRRIPLTTCTTEKSWREVLSEHLSALSVNRG